MDATTARRWKNRWDLVAEVQAEEQRGYSAARRLAQMGAIRQLALRRGMKIADAGEFDVWRRWARMKGAADT
jgi:hypothetical protein